MIKGSLENRFGLLVLIALANRPAGPVCAQEPGPSRDPNAFVNQQRAVDELLRKDFDAQLRAASALESDFEADWGGWYSLHFFLFDDGIESSRTLRRHDVRLWGRASWDAGAHALYARVRLSLLDFNAGDAYGHPFHQNEDDIEGPNLERGVYRFDMGRWRAASGQESLEYNVVASAGRDLVQFGTGISLATPLDHLALQYMRDDYQLTALVGRTVGSGQDFDLSRTAKRLRRDFIGGQIVLTGDQKHRPFLYALWQRDRNREHRWQPFRKYDYDSFYLGLGSTGELMQHIRYEAELVYETGQSHNSRWFLGSSNIEAWAVRAELEYLIPGESRARASVEYLFGSGDADRLGSPTDTIGSNRGDFADESFIAFGYSDTGLVLAPRYSNLHIWRTGASFYPFHEYGGFRTVEVGTDWYLFQKHHHRGAISDPTANLRSGYVGWEMDYFVNWRVASDLAWTARFGAFFPGEAYSDRTTRTFLLVGMTWSF